MTELMAGTHNLAVVLDGNIALRRGITEEELFTEVTLLIRKIVGVKVVYAYELRAEPRAETHDTTSSCGKLIGHTSDGNNAPLHCTKRPGHEHHVAEWVNAQDTEASK